MSMDRETWLAERSTGIGSSDAPAIVGVSPWKTALQLYLEKTDQAPPWEGNAATRWGLKLEETVAEAYEETTGVQLASAEPILRHEQYPWMLCSLDRITADGSKIVELKTASAYLAHEWGQAGTDEIPDAYIVQVQHQMAIYGGQSADVAVLIGGSDFRVYQVPRSEVVIARLIEIEAEFWARIQARNAPEPDWQHGSTPGLIRAMHGVEDGLEISLGQEAADLAASYQDIGADIKGLEAQRDEIKARLLHAMGPATLAHLPGGVSLTRKEVTRKAYQVAESSYLDFRIKQPKQKKVKA